MSADAMDDLRRAVAELLGHDPETWPEHGNAPLAIAAAVALLVRSQPAVVTEKRAYAGVVLWSGDREVRLTATRAEVESEKRPNLTMRGLIFRGLAELSEPQ